MNMIEMLQVALKDEENFTQAEALYCESFKAEGTFKAVDGVFDRDDLISYLVSDVCEPVNWQEVPDWFEPSVIKEGWSIEKAEALVDHLEFVELCNYKGEGEGFTLVCRAANLRTFVGKYDYL